jgi:hypothetical protein
MVQHNKFVLSLRGGNDEAIHESLRYARDDILLFAGEADLLAT